MWSDKQKQTTLRAAKDEELQVLGFGRDGFCYSFSAPINTLPQLEDSACLEWTLKFYLSKYLRKGDEEKKRNLYCSFVVALEAATRDGDLIRGIKLPSGDAVVTLRTKMR
ncbi:unnamed protein product [Blepharisma stoltei]|uniref:Uncharacterized protein n=1 Tax=Blepharisma stoltei TaxID=1481888 RepID=A0AAU9K3S3_9CILI|nr:unnamed protein product [Blepharisma stoltei]